MLTLEELKKDRALVNSIDWDMTPEMAVRMYLEWGNIWTPGEGRRYTVKSKNDYSVYFVVNCWQRPYYIYLIRRNSEDAVSRTISIAGTVRKTRLSAEGHVCSRR